MCKKTSKHWAQLVHTEFAASYLTPSSFRKAYINNKDWVFWFWFAHRIWRRRTIEPRKWADHRSFYLVLGLACSSQFQESVTRWWISTCTLGNTQSTHHLFADQWPGKCQNFKEDSWQRKGFSFTHPRSQMGHRSCAKWTAGITFAAIQIRVDFMRQISINDSCSWIYFNVNKCQRCINKGYVQGFLSRITRYENIMDLKWPSVFHLFSSGSCYNSHPPKRKKKLHTSIRQWVIYSASGLMKFPYETRRIRKSCYHIPHTNSFMSITCSSHFLLFKKQASLWKVEVYKVLLQSKVNIFMVAIIEIWQI